VSVAAGAAIGLLAARKRRGKATVARRLDLAAPYVLEIFDEQLMHGPTSSSRLDRGRAAGVAAVGFFAAGHRGGLAALARPPEAGTALDLLQIFDEQLFHESTLQEEKSAEPDPALLDTAVSGAAVRFLATREGRGKTALARELEIGTTLNLLEIFDEQFLHGLTSWRADPGRREKGVGTVRTGSPEVNDFPAGP
jgi:hypothetical protein